jgi:Na+-translocating ferredoxin:NAD+ oxidoreductase RnfC subunit
MKRRTFRRGIHPPERKATAGRPVERLPAPEKAFVPFLQHFGKPAIPLVKAGERVFLGQKIGEAAGTFSSSVHAPVSGKVLALDLHPFPSGTPVLAAAIENDGLDTRAGDPEKPADPFILSSETILQKVREFALLRTKYPQGAEKMLIQAAAPLSSTKKGSIAFWGRHTAPLLCSRTEKDGWGTPGIRFQPIRRNFRRSAR